MQWGGERRESAKMLQCAAEGGGPYRRPKGERAFRALSLGWGIGDRDWWQSQMQHPQRRDNGGVIITDRESPPRSRWASEQPGRHAPARACPGGCPPARQSAEAAAAAPRGVTARSQWLRWRRARDCTADRRRAAREGRPSPPPAALAFREGSLDLRPGVDEGIQMAASGGKRAGRGGLAAAPPSPREGSLDAGLRVERRWGVRWGSPGAGRGAGSRRGWKSSRRSGAGLQASTRPGTWKQV